MLRSPAAPRNAELNQASDKRLMQRVREGDVRALSAIFDRHGSAAYALAYRICGTRSTAEGVVEEAFVSLWRKAPAYGNPGRAVRPWLLSITHTMALDALRSASAVDRHATIDTSTQAVDAGGRSDADGVSRDEAGWMRSRLSALPAPQRDAIALAYFEGLGHDEIAQRLCLPPGTVKGEIRLGLQTLRRARDESRS